MLSVLYCSSFANASMGVGDVVGMIKKLRDQVKDDGKKEEAAFDKYSKWCEDKLEEKATNMDDYKNDITEASSNIKRLSGEVGSLTAEIANLKSLIEDNNKATEEATNIREKERATHIKSTSDNEQCMGALEAAIKVLTGAGTGKFLQTMQEAQLLSVVPGVKQAIMSPIISQSVTDADMEAVRRFVEKPQAVVSRSSMSAAQVGQNPFGDYAPQSGQIQGILKSMYDSLATEIESSNADESNKQKAYEELMDTKADELNTLKDNLEKNTESHSDKSLENAETKEMRQQRQELLADTEKYFEETKSTCERKAEEFANRVKLRSQEVDGMEKAIEILDSPEARKTLKESADTFMQLKAVRYHSDTSSEQKRRATTKAFNVLRSVARKENNLALGELAARVMTSNEAFGLVLQSIDDMLKNLHNEEQHDIAEKDRCETETHQANVEKGDLETSVANHEDHIKSLNSEQKELDDKIRKIRKEIGELVQEMAESLAQRNEEVAAFKKAYSEDAKSVELLKGAIAALTKFYKDNDLPMELVQKAKGQRGDPDEAPDAGFADGDYKGRSSEGGGIVSVLTGIKEKTEMELKESMENENKAQADYQAETNDARNSLNKMLQTNVTLNEALNQAEENEGNEEGGIESDNKEKANVQKRLDALQTQCQWVEESFDKRRQSREEEVRGLEKAKSTLMGAGSD